MRMPRKILCDQDTASNDQRVDEQPADGAIEPKDVFLIRGRIPWGERNENIEGLSTG
jgi:hypothetical protein